MLTTMRGILSIGIFFMMSFAFLLMILKVVRLEVNTHNIHNSTGMEKSDRGQFLSYLALYTIFLGRSLFFIFS